MSILKIKDGNGNWVGIPAIKGDPGDDYVLTNQDKSDIADIVTEQIQTTLDGKIDDVTVNGDSVVSNGVANIPVAGNNYGVLRVQADGSKGVVVNTSNGVLQIMPSSNEQIKGGTEIYRPIVPYFQYASTFYGLAKAAGDTTQSASSNAVGTYTDEAKAAIQDMLDVPSNGDLALKMPIVSFGEETVLMDTTEFTLTKDGDNPWYEADLNVNTFPRNSLFLANTKYTVTINNVDYVVNNSGRYTYVDNENTWGGFCIGNKTCLGYTQDDDFPLCIHYVSYLNENKQNIVRYKIVVYSQEQTTTITRTIKIIGQTINVEYVPEDYYKEYPYFIKNGGSNSLVIGHGAFDASGDGAIAEGFATRATGNASHAFGTGSVSSGLASHAEGYFTEAGGIATHTEGHKTVTTYRYAHAEGDNTKSTGDATHSEGTNTTASAIASHAEGHTSAATANAAHAEGANTTASGLCSHAEGAYTVANHRAQHVFGRYNIADPSESAYNANGNYIEIVGNGTADNARSNARTLDWDGNEVLAGKLTVGTNPTAAMDVATKQYVDNTNWFVENEDFHGINALKTKDFSFSGVTFSNTSSGIASLAIGINTTANGQAAFASGSYTKAPGHSSHAEGFGTIANGGYSYVFGSYNIADNYDNLDEWVADTQYNVGDKVKVTDGSTVTGYQCKTANNDSTFNSSKWTRLQKMNYVEIVGNGVSGSRSNARTLDWNGNEVLAGKLAVGVGPTADMDVATKLYVDTQIGTCVSDVQLNGTSIVSGGVANIPMASNNALGVIKVNASSYGIGINSNDGCLYIGGATDAAIKEGTATYRVIFPQKQHQAVFYGLAKASGDTTQSASSNAVGSYTDSAKASIKSMLGIGDRLSDIEVEVTGTTPTITANSSTRYICGEVTEVTFTPPASGTTELIFTSGSTVPTLTLPSTVLMPEWFVIEPNRIYQISIENNRYGVVASWPVA